MLIDECQDGSDRLVEGELVVDRGGGVVRVTGVVDPGPLDHEEKSVLRRSEPVEGGSCHFGERGHGALQLGNVRVVDAEGQVALAEDPEERLCGISGSLSGRRANRRRRSRPRRSVS